MIIAKLFQKNIIIQKNNKTYYKKVTFCIFSVDI